MNNNTNVNLNGIVEKLISMRKELDSSSLLFTPIQNMMDCIIGELLLTSTGVKRSIRNIEKKHNFEGFIFDMENSFVIGFSPSYIAPHLGIRIQKDIQDRFELVLKIDDETSIESIRNNWYKILQIKQLLRDTQGSDPYDIDYQLLQQVEELKEKGYSYNQLATKINYLFLLELCHIIYMEKNGETNETFLKLGEYHASDLLTPFMIKNVEIQEWLSISLEEIRKGKLPWYPKHGPISSLRVRDALRLWQIRKLKGQVVTVDSPIDPFHTLIGEYRIKEVVEFFDKLEKIG